MEDRVLIFNFPNDPFSLDVKEDMSDSNQFIFLAPISYLLTLHHKIFIDETKFRVTEETGGDEPK